MRLHWPFLAVGALIIALIVVWVAVADPFAGASNKSNRYSEAVIGSPRDVNPLLASLNDVDRDLSLLVFSGLTRLGPRGEVQPDLAESWSVSEDGRTYQFKLRPGVKWQSGADFSADDVLFTYGLMAAQDFPGDPALKSFWQEVKCSKRDTLEIACTLPTPFAPFLASVSIGILPRSELESLSAAQMAGSAFNRSPVGTGPYRLEHLDAASALLEANPDYHLGKPQIPEIELRFYPDAQSAMSAFFRRDVQGICVGPNVSQDDLDSLTSSKNVRVFTANRTSYTAFYLNDLQPPFDDVKVRQAIAYGIDRDAIISGLLSGRAIRADSPIPPGTWAYNNDIAKYGFDQGKARSLLDEAGWTTSGGTVVRQKAGQRLEFSLITDSDPLRRAIAQEIARELGQINISVKLVPLASTDLVKDFLLPLSYQSAIFGFDPGYDPDPYPAWHGSQVYNGANLAGYRNLIVDILLEQGRQLTDPTQRRALYAQFQDVFAKDEPSVLLYYPVYSYIIDKSVKDVSIGTLFDLSSRFAGIQNWKIESKGPLG
ncbi:MAG TPA: peptide ABC transporter substrate-binding protein [Dehalococcoidia bacterium]|nr:peptide ABC transporter substrate-binding protein [Dehalococcoidia bacterium]